MPPVLTVTPNEIEQLIECVRSKPYLYHDAQRAYNDWKEIATEMEKEGIGLHRPPMDPYLSVLSFFHTFHVILSYAYGHKHLLIPRSGP